MPKVNFAPDIANISGRLSKKDNVVYALNKKTGKVHRYDMNHTDSNTADQQAVRTAFSTKAQLASAWWNANKPLKAANGTVTREASADFKAVMARYDAQSKIGNPYGYFLSIINSENKAKVGSLTIDLTATTGNTDTNTPSGGNSNPGGADIEA